MVKGQKRGLLLLNEELKQKAVVSAVAGMISMHGEKDSKKLSKNIENKT